MFTPSRIGDTSDIIQTGVIQNGGIALDGPLPLADGVKVQVFVEELTPPPAAAQPMSDADFRSLPFFGEWSDQADLGPSEDYVREERAKWSQRLAREG